MTKTSLRALSLQFALALVVAATIATISIAPARAATHPSTLASDTGWPGELVNRPMCGSERGYDSRPACEAGRH